MKHIQDLSAATAPSLAAAADIGARPENVDVDEEIAEDQEMGDPEDPALVVGGKTMDHEKPGKAGTNSAMA